MLERQRQLDARIEIVTPENIEFEYRLAGPFQRLQAYAIDQLLLFLGLAVCGIVLLLLSISIRTDAFLLGAYLIAYFVAQWFYGGLFETYWNGQTPGKRQMGLRVVSVDGQPINALQAVMRNILRSVDGMPMWPLFGSFMFPLFQVGLLAAMASKKYQRLGDLACGTIVIVEGEQRMAGVTRLDDAAALALAARLPVGVVVNRSLAKALAMYIERRKHFPPARRAEVARFLAQPLIDKYGLPPDTNYDLLLCAFYCRTFITDRASETAPEPAQAPKAKAKVVIPQLAEVVEAEAVDPFEFPLR